MLILANIVAKKPIIEDISKFSKSLKEFSIKSVKLPIIMIPEIALVTLIRGVWRAGVTAHTTKYPTKIARIKTIKLIILKFLNHLY